MKARRCRSSRAIAKRRQGGLDDTQLRTWRSGCPYLRELEERRAAIITSIDEQKKLTPELRASIEAADTKQRLEDLYLPYKPKRRTKAQIAREAGPRRAGGGAARRSFAGAGNRGGEVFEAGVQERGGRRQPRRGGCEGARSKARAPF